MLTDKGINIVMTNLPAGGRMNVLGSLETIFLFFFGAVGRVGERLIEGEAVTGVVIDATALSESLPL